MISHLEYFRFYIEFILFGISILEKIWIKIYIRKMEIEFLYSRIYSI